MSEDWHSLTIDELEARLSDQQRAWIERYLVHWNARRAARETGYQQNSAYSVKHHPLVREYIHRRLEDLRLDADEVLVRLSYQARASIGDFITFDKRGGWRFDIAAAQKADALGLIKKLRRAADGSVEIELYDAQAALEKLGRHHRLFTEQVDVTSAGQRIKGYVMVSPDDWDTDDGDTGSEAESVSEAD
jgi:phage terminase small subunit